MKKICIFGGTAEGRKLANFLARSNEISLTVCVATDYQQSPTNKNITVRQARLTEEEMRLFISSEQFDLVISAVHPYANEAEKNIKSACEKAEKEYIRLLRESSPQVAGHYVESIDEAVDYLNSASSGNIFVTTGANEIHKYTAVNNFQERVYLRILPFEESLMRARESGFTANKIIAMQGPFSRELNIAMLKSINAKYIVSKDGGKEGGFYEKMSAAESLGTKAIIIGRRQEQKGATYAEVISLLARAYDIAVNPEIVIIGIGPGELKSLTLEASEAIKNSSALIGSQRALDLFNDLSKPSFAAIAPEKIADIIESKAEIDSFALLMSGDTGFFSGAKKLADKFKEARIICGISSVSYFCAKLRISWDDIKLISLHGRSTGLIHAVKTNRRTMVLVGGSDGVNRLAEELCKYSYGNLKLSIGERLSYPNERITIGSAAELKEASFDSLSLVLIENEPHKSTMGFGFPDDDFIRADIPMTKSEVRSIIMSKLKLTNDSIVYDIGAGTGSVAVEMAVAAQAGEVYAIEKNPPALPLIEANKGKFVLPNLHVVEGTAPQALLKLPAPSHAFIGGSSGNMKDIVSALLNKNENVRMVASAITLETICELMHCADHFKFKYFEVVQLSVSKSKKLGSYNMMLGQNPVYIVCMQEAGGLK